LTCAPMTVPYLSSAKHS